MTLTWTKPLRMAESQAPDKSRDMEMWISTLGCKLETEDHSSMPNNTVILTLSNTGVAIH